MEATKSILAWQPLTPRGVAAFAHAPLRRLLLVQAAVALLVGAASAWFCYDAYFPVIHRTIAQLPDAGEIRGQQLDWRGDSPVLFAENRFLALNVDLDQTRQIRSLSHVQIELGRTNIVAHSLLGYATFRYPDGWIIAVNRPELFPLWGAWRSAILAGIILTTGVGVMISWWLLALLYAGPVRFYSYFLDREVSWTGAWRLSGAALLPGALLVIIGLSCYDFGLMDLVQFSFVYAAHIVVGWTYLLLSPPFLGKAGKPTKATPNPFAR